MIKMFFLFVGLVLCVAGLANAALVSGPADLDLTNVVKAINFGIDAGDDGGGGILATDETVGGTTFSVANVNTTVDGVTNVASAGVGIAHWGATSPEFGSTDDDDALERIYGSSIYASAGTVDISTPLGSGTYNVQVLLYEGWTGGRNVTVTAEGTVADSILMGATTHPDGLVVSVETTVTDGTLDITVVSDVGGNMHVSGLIITEPNPAMVPTPSNRAIDVPISQILSWTESTDPSIVTILGYDVYLDPNEANVAAGDPSVLVSPIGTQGTSLTYDPSPDLAFSETYFWRIDVHANVASGTDTIEGRVWSFTSISAAPVIVDYDSVITTSALLPADLSAVVTDADDDVSSVSFELLPDDVSYPAGAVASVTDTTIDMYAPTATFTTDTEGIYVVKLTISDDEGHSTEAIAQISVADDACDAAQATPSWAGFNIRDFDTDCDVDLADLAAFALEWLDDRNLYAAVTYVGSPVYIPVVNGIANGNFEMGSFAGWTLGPGTITDDASEGIYAATFDDASGVATGSFDLPVGTGHTITLWYKGDLTKLVCGVTPDVVGSVAITNLAAYGPDYLLVNSTVSSYTEYTVIFDVTTANTSTFFVWGIADTWGDAFVDDFQLNLAP